MPATVERISVQAEPLAALLPTLDRLEHAVVQKLAATHEMIEPLKRHEATLNDNVEKLGTEIVALHGPWRDSRRMSSASPSDCPMRRRARSRRPATF